MKITFLTVGKTEDAYLKEGIDKYVKRLKHYTKLELTEIPELKNTKALSPEQQKAKKPS
jgi:23S rRNA (pseudouridine1915-N3)-methyltransferase